MPKPLLPCLSVETARDGLIMCHDYNPISTKQSSATRPIGGECFYLPLYRAGIIVFVYSFISGDVMEI
jgi:hypothetical protein